MIEFYNMWFDMVKSHMTLFPCILYFLFWLVLSSVVITWDNIKKARDPFHYFVPDLIASIGISVFAVIMTIFLPIALTCVITLATLIGLFWCICKLTTIWMLR
ncbi:hypothetical protein [Escherichia phage UPEC06]|nr:hypothetical protein [Escherichia phage UPEC06]